jgi:hypothetical protein
MFCRRPFALFLQSLLFVGITSSAAEAAPRKVDLKKVKLFVSIKDDPTFSRTETDFHVNKNGKKVKLHFPAGREPKGLYSGLLVNVKGKELSSAAVSVGTEATSFQVVGGEIPLGVGGIRQVLVLKIQSTSAVSSATAAGVAGALAGADSWYQESSYQMLSIKNDRDANGVPDFYTVPISSSSAGVGEASAFSLCSTAKTNAKSKFGIDPALWTHVICILPPDMNYSWFGTAYINGTDIVINGNYANGYPGGYTHELGHNIGLHHSNTPGVEYGESACVMGGNAGTAKRDFNGPHKLQLNWLAVSTAGAGSYQLNAIEAQAGQRTAPHNLLKIRDTVANQDLYISYRSPLGTLGSGLDSPYRLSIHAYPGGAVQTQLIGTVGDGQTFTRNGISISQTAHTTTSSSVTIGANCAVAAPLVQISPVSALRSLPTAVSYTISLTNKDMNCSSPTTYSIAGVVPTGWTAVAGSSTVTAAPGATVATSINVTPPAGVLTGSYAIVVNADASGHARGTGTASYVFDNTAPTGVTTLKATAARKGGKVSLTWSATTDLGSGIADYIIFRNGAPISSTASTSFSDQPGTGSFAYAVTVRDKAGNQSGMSNGAIVSVSASKAAR